MVAPFEAQLGPVTGTPFGHTHIRVAVAVWVHFPCKTPTDWLRVQNRPAPPVPEVHAASPQMHGALLTKAPPVLLHTGATMHRQWSPELQLPVFTSPGLIFNVPE